MTYITCSHPSNKTMVRTEVVKTTDILVNRTVPKPYCKGCKCYLPILESPGRELIRFWFIKQDNKVKALPTV